MYDSKYVSSLYAVVVLNWNDIVTIHSSVVAFNNTLLLFIVVDDILPSILSSLWPTKKKNKLIIHGSWRTHARPTARQA